MPSTAPGVRPPALLLPFTSRSVAVARRALITAMRGQGLSKDFTDDAVLVLSELISNALRHARPLQGTARRFSGEAIRVAWSIGADEVHLEVTDGGASTRPRLGAPTRSATGGRGLHIVRDLTSDWGVVEESGEQARGRAGVAAERDGTDDASGAAHDELQTMTVWATLRRR